MWFCFILSAQHKFYPLFKGQSFPAWRFRSGGCKYLTTDCLIEQLVWIVSINYQEALLKSQHSPFLRKVVPPRSAVFAAIGTFQPVCLLVIFNFREAVKFPRGIKQVDSECCPSHPGPCFFPAQKTNFLKPQGQASCEQYSFSTSFTAFSLFFYLLSYFSELLLVHKSLRTKNLSQAI